MSGRNVSVTVSEDGIEIRRDAALFSTEYFDWDEVEQIVFSTDESRIEAPRDDRLPLKMDAEAMRILPPDTDSVGGKENNHGDDSETFNQQLERETGITVTEEGVDFPDGPSPTDVFSKFVRFVFDEGYLTRSDLPIQTPRAQKNYVLHTEPTDSRGNRLPDTREPIEGVYFDVKPPKGQKEYHVNYIIERHIEN